MGRAEPPDSQGPRPPWTVGVDDLHEAQALAGVGSWTWDLLTGVVTWSPELFRIFGLEPAQFLMSYRSYLNGVHPDDRNLVLAVVERAFAGPTDFEMDYRYVMPGGDLRWLHGRGRLLVDAAGQVTRMVGTVQDVTDQKATEERLRHDALHDHLTGLPNRVLLLDRLGHALERAARERSTVVVLFADLDQFKAVNDRFGHEVGDRVLVEVAGRLRTALRPGDTVARWGGDEFVGVCEDVSDRVAAELLGTRLVEAVEATGVTRDVALSASVGIALSSSRDETAGDLVRLADTAMYRAKTRGAGHVEVSGR